MAEHTKQLVQNQFGRHASEYVTSKGHATGKSLDRLFELTAPEPSWRVLDVATGGGHTALAFSPHVSLVVAADLTCPMLSAAREFAQSKQRFNIAFLQSDSERLAVANASFDCITCRIAAHHFPSVDAFATECYRALRPGGIIALVDNIVSGEIRVARYINAFEKLRDPSHHWAYSQDDWEAILYSAGFDKLHSETVSKDLDFIDWAGRLGVAGSDLTRLQAMLVQCPGSVRDWLKPRIVGGKLTFSLTELVLIARRR